jgi:hypothetical protein
MKNKDNALSWITNSITYVCAIVSTSEVAQIILYCLGIVGTLVSIAYNIYIWYVKAHADGKISKHEVDELKDTLDKGVDEIKNKTKEK